MAYYACQICHPTTTAVTLVTCLLRRAADAAVQAHLRASIFDPYKSEVPMLPADIKTSHITAAAASAAAIQAQTC
jgi:exoribonuclease R